MREKNFGTWMKKYYVVEAFFFGIRRIADIA